MHPTGAALISGGASGLGAATARRLHAAGVSVLIADLDEARGRDLAEELGDGAAFCLTDVTREESIDRAAAEAHAMHSDGLRISVSCAGVYEAATLVSSRARHDLGMFELALRVNLMGTFLQMRAAAGLMLKNAPRDDERGVLICTVSVAASEGTRGTIAYSASKAGVAGMVLPAARDLGHRGIRVCGISPGNFQTPMTASDPEEVTDEIIRQTPFPKRLGHPDEFAALVESIVRNQMLNGAVLRLDGGLRMN